MAFTKASASARPLKVDQAYDRLRRLIVTLEIAPGTPIDERELMDRLDIGRTPLREAVFRLIRERLIIHSPRRGAWVSELSVTDLQQMMDARLFIEPLVARKAAERVTPDDLQELGDVLAAAAEQLAAGDAEQLVDLDLEFHSKIACLGGNSYLADFSNQLNTSMLRYWHLSSRHAITLPTWYVNHQMLLNTLAAGNPDLASQRAKEHIESFRERLRELLV